MLNLATPLGLILAAAGRSTIRRGPHGLLLAEGWRLPLAAGAFTVGNVVITAGRFRDLTAALPQVLEHEARHSSQWLRWGGLPFLLAYAAGAAWSLARTGRAGPGNPFERAAGLAEGGYPVPPTTASDGPRGAAVRRTAPRARRRSRR